jgi:hypothetical protein
MRLTRLLYVPFIALLLPIITYPDRTNGQDLPLDQLVNRETQERVLTAFVNGAHVLLELTESGALDSGIYAAYIHTFGNAFPRDYVDPDTVQLDGGNISNQDLASLMAATRLITGGDYPEDPCPFCPSVNDKCCDEFSDPLDHKCLTMTNYDCHLIVVNGHNRCTQASSDCDD